MAELSKMNISLIVLRGHGTHLNGLGGAKTKRCSLVCDAMVLLVLLMPRVLLIKKKQKTNKTVATVVLVVHMSAQ